MTSTISLSKVNAVLKKNFRLNIASLIVTNVTAVLAALVICDMFVGIPSNEYSYSSYTSDITSEFSVSASLIINVLGVINLLFLSLKMFREIYSRRASDFFYSMPVTRKEYYIGNVLFGIINILFLFISVIAASLIFGKLPIVFDVEHNILDVKIFLKYMIIAVAEIFLIFAVFIVSAVLSGRRWQVVAASVLSSISLSVIMIGVGMQLNTIYGYNIENNGSAVDIFLAILNKGEYVSPAISVIFRFATAAALLAVGYFVFKNRKAEVAEQSLSGKIVPALLLFIIDVAVFITAFSAFNSLALYFKILISVVFCVIITVIFCAVFNKKAFTKNTDIVCVAACVVSIAFAVGVETLPKAVGYIDYMPSAEEIQSVEFTENADNYAYINNSYYFSYLYYLFNGGIDYSEDEPDTVKIESQEGIDCVLKIHQKALSDEVVKKYKSYNDPNEEFYTDDNFFSYKLTYHLENGKDVTRYYSVCCKDMLEEYAALVKTDEYIDQSFPFTLDKDSILFARVEEPYEDTEVYDDSWEYTDDYSVSYSADSYFTLDDYDEFFSLLKQDMKARSDIDALLQTTSYIYLMNKYIENDQYIYIYYLNDNVPAELEEKIRKMTPSQVETYMYNSNEDLNVMSEAVILSTTGDKNTMDYLTERGIIKQ